MRMASIVLVALCLLMVVGCTTPGTYKVKAYDLKGEKIYDDEMVQDKHGNWTTKDGRRVFFNNATVIREEIKP